MSGLVGHSGKTGNLGQIGSGEILIQDTVINSGATLIMDNVFTGEFRNYNRLKNERNYLVSFTSCFFF